MESSRPITIGISLGDITGIGPEVTLKALAAEALADDTRYLLIGDAEHTRVLNRQLGLNLPLQDDRGNDESGRFVLCQPLDELPRELIESSPAAARAAVEWVKEGALRCLPFRRAQTARRLHRLSYAGHPCQFTPELPQPSNRNPPLTAVIRS